MKRTILPEFIDDVLRMARDRMKGETENLDEWMSGFEKELAEMDHAEIIGIHLRLRLA